MLRNRCIIALMALAILGPLQYAMYHVDEGMFIESAYRVSKGDLLYKDVGAVVGPFPILVGAAIFRTFGSSVFIFRFVFSLAAFLAALSLYSMLSNFNVAKSISLFVSFFFLWTIPPVFAISHHFISSIFVVWALHGVLVWLGCRKLFWSGCAVGVVLHTHILRGVAFLGLFLFYLLFRWWKKGQSSSAFNVSVVYFLLGVLLVGLCIPVYFAWQGTFSCYVQQVVTRRFRYANHWVGAIPYGTTSVYWRSYSEIFASPSLIAIFVQQLLMFSLPVLLIFLMVIRLLPMNWKVEFCFGRLLFIATAILLWGSILYAPSPGKLPAANALILPALILLIDPLQKSFGGALLAKGIKFVIVVSILLYGTKAVAKTILFCMKNHVSVETKCGRVVITEPQLAADVIQIRKFLKGRTTPAFVYPYEPRLYIFCNLENPTEYNVLTPEVHSDKDHDRVIETMRRHPDALIIQDGSSHRKSKFRTWYEAHYKRVFSCSRWIIFRRASL